MMMISSMKVCPNFVIFFLNEIIPKMLLIMLLIKSLHYHKNRHSNLPRKVVTKSLFLFVVEYNNSLPNIGLILNKYWDLLQLSRKDSVIYVHEYKPILAFKRPRNLRDFLVHSAFKDKTSHFSQAYDRRRCSHCKNIIKTDVFTSTCTQNSFNLRFSTNCMSQNVIYLIECKRRNKQYVGQTNQQVSKRMNSHYRFDINNHDSDGYATNAALHFNSDSHSIADFSFLPIDVVNDEMTRLCKDKLETMYPKCMNSELLYNAE